MNVSAATIELSEFETNLNRILRLLLGASSMAESGWLLRKQHQRPKCLSRKCVELVQDTLAKGCTSFFARRGWQFDRFIHDGEPRSGRLWQRYAPEQMSLEFSRNTMRLLIWLTAEDVSRPKQSMAIRREQLTIGDHLLNLIAVTELSKEHGSLAQTNNSSLLLRRSLFRLNPINWFFLAEALAGKLSGMDPASENPFVEWFRPDRVWVVETLQKDIARNWSKLEVQKRRFVDPQTLLQLSETQQRTIDCYLTAADNAGRRDLGLWLLGSASEAMSDWREDSAWFENLNLSQFRLTERQSLYKSALCLFHAVARVGGWHDDFMNVSYYDEDYQASQLWKSKWESIDGDRIRRASRELIQSVAPLRV